MDTHRFSSALMVFGVVGLAATGCSQAESKDNPDNEPVPAAEQLASEDVAAQPPESEAAASEAPEVAKPVTKQPPAEPPRAEPKPAPVEPAAPPAPRLFAPAGTQMTFRLDTSLSTKSNQIGDRFQTTLIEDVLSAEGVILVPLGSVARGVVVQSQESQGSDAPAVLSLRLEVLDVHGATQPFEATIVESQGSADTRDSGGESAIKVAAGTAAGALFGRIIGGDSKGTAIGAGTGAVVGTVFAVTTKGGHAQMDQGAILLVRLDEPLPLG